MKKLLKKLLTGAVILFVGIVVLGAVIPSEDKEQKSVEVTPMEQQSLPEGLLPSYEIVERDEQEPSRGVKRVLISVVTEFPAREEQIKKIAEQVIEEQKKVESFNALLVFFSDRKELLYGGYSLAKVTYAPNGDWSKASEVKTGDYSSHQVVYEFRDKVKEPEKYVGKRPTEEESSLCAAFHRAGIDNPELVQSEVLTPEQIDEKVAGKVAGETGVSIEKILNAVYKCAEWMASM